MIIVWLQWPSPILKERTVVFPFAQQADHNSGAVFPAADYGRLRVLDGVGGAFRNANDTQIATQRKQTREKPMLGLIVFHMMGFFSTINEMKE